MVAGRKARLPTVQHQRRRRRAGRLRPTRVAPRPLAHDSPSRPGHAPGCGLRCSRRGSSCPAGHRQLELALDQVEFGARRRAGLRRPSSHGCRLPPSPAFPGSACPQVRSGRCDVPTEVVSHHLSNHTAPRGAQLRREESRRRRQDRIRPAELPVLPLQLGQLVRVAARGPGPAARIDLGLTDPATQRLGVDAELLTDPTGRSEPRRRVLAGVRHCRVRRLARAGSAPPGRRRATPASSDSRCTFTLPTSSLRAIASTGSAALVGVGEVAGQVRVEAHAHRSDRCGRSGRCAR